MENCKTCARFKRYKYHKVLGGGDQTCGECKLLLEILMMDNASITFEKKIIVQDTFGCIMHKEKE